MSQENKNSVPPSLQRTVFNPISSGATYKEQNPSKNNFSSSNRLYKWKKPMVLQCCMSPKSRQNSFLLYKLKQASAVMLIWKT